MKWLQDCVRCKKLVVSFEIHGPLPSAFLPRVGRTHCPLCYDTNIGTLSSLATQRSSSF